MKTKLTITLLSILMYGLSGCGNKTQPSADINPLFTGTRAEEAFPDEEGKPQTGTFNGQKIAYMLINGQAVFERDILLDTTALHAATTLHTEGTGRSKTTTRWPNKIVYYAIDPTLPNQQRVTDAMAQWEANTPIRFVPHTTQRGYVLFRPGPGCSANVGYAGSVQYVNLATSCTTGSTVHEIGHTIGLWHEQSRVDRDTYITIHPENILPAYTTDFATYAQQGMDGFDAAGGLDFASIMLYSSFDFSRNGLPTITKKDGTTFTSQRQHLSPLDIATVKVMYP